MAQDAASLIDRLDAELPSESKNALRVLISLCESRGGALYLVGGAVRDLLRGAGHVDLDLTVEGDVAPIAEALAAATGGRAVLHPRFDTATVSGTGFSLDLVHTRRETYERPGALPAVEFSNLHDDLARRDFTVNAMALRLSQPAGELVDPFGGRSDLQQGLVRVLHEGSFRDDATRLLRAIRYATRLDFRIEAETLSWLQRDVSFLDTISGARVRRELVLMLEEPSAVEATLESQRLGILAAVHPSLALPEDVAIRWRQARTATHADAGDIALAVLLNPATEASAASLVERLHLSGRQQAVLADLVRLQGLSAKLAASRERPAEVVSLLENASPSAIEALAVREGAHVAEACEAYLTRWRRIRPHLRGDDLLALGVPPGPRVGALLAELRRGRLEARLSTKEEEIELVRRELGLENP